jgi:hypothetical protein
MTKRQVHRIYDTSGYFADGGAGGYARAYQRCVDSSPKGMYCETSVEYAVNARGIARVAAKTWRESCVAAD